MNNILKRDGQVAVFNPEKIADAVSKAFMATGEIGITELSHVCMSASRKVARALTEKYADPVGIEDVQNEVERALMEAGYPRTAKAYIIYRARREAERNRRSKLMMTLDKIIRSEAKDTDIKRENANIDGKTAMGVMLKSGSESSKAYYEDFMLPERAKDAFHDGYIHIHDLDFYSLTLTCCQIDLEKLFRGGFSTGHGSLREPNSIASYGALAAIAIQANQNDQHGGQSVPNLDRAMAVGVRKTHRKNFARHLSDALGMLFRTEDIPDVAEQLAEAEGATGETVGVGTEPGSVYGRGSALAALAGMIDAVIPLYDAEVNLDDIRKSIVRAAERAWRDTNKQTFQAMESLIHNLNSMHSRAGAQVPFSSINYGTDTSPEGRMVIKNVLLTTIDGLGKGETPIFPIQVFRLKKGVNFDPGDPNYDLFRLALKCSAKRMFPNFSFQDAPYNIKYYDPDNPATEISYMGCVDGREVITYKINGQLFVEPFEKAYDRLVTLFGFKFHGKSNYVDVENYGVAIHDTHAGGFVPVRKFIINPDMGNWHKVRLSDGRCLLATADHPLPVEGKGRTEVRDLTEGDKISVTYSQHSEEIYGMDTDFAWLLGLILCDGSYAGNICISLGMDEDDIARHVNAVAEKYGFGTSVINQERGDKGTYRDINFVMGRKLMPMREKLLRLYEGSCKADRIIPNAIFSATREAKLAFLAGMIDADGYVNHSKSSTARVQIGSTNKGLALQQMCLVQALGYPAKVYENRYAGNGSGKIRHAVEFTCNGELLKYVKSGKKTSEYHENGYRGAELRSPGYAEVTEVLPVEHRYDSYDVETASDRFDVSGILSHNCRTRVINNVHDPAQEISYGRGNLSFTTINLPRLAIEEKGENAFYAKLDETLELVMEQLLERFEVLANKKAENFPFLMEQGVWLGSEKLKRGDAIREVMKHGTMSIGFIGLAEALTEMHGAHHGESAESQEHGLKIIKHMRDFCDRKSEELKLNVTLLATPAEGLSGRFVKIDREKHGMRAGVTDRNYYTNSFHIPVSYKIGIAEKIRLEAPYHALTNAGHITYVEVDGSIGDNLEAFESIVRHMGSCGIGYGAVNHPLDRDTECGYSGVIGDECPKCGRTESKGAPFERIRRITGYLVGTLERFNNAKRDEERDRVKHVG